MTDFLEGQAERDATTIAAFGETVRWREPGAATKEITAIFQNPSRPRDGAPRSVGSRDPTLVVLRSDVSDTTANTRIEVRSEDYRIREVTEDEGEWIRLKLEKI